MIGRYAAVRAVFDVVVFELGQKPTGAAMDHPAFVPGRAARVHTHGGLEGVIGELHPEALVDFGLDLPVGLVDFRVAPRGFREV